jgi:predicted metal-binding membrane protein
MSFRAATGLELLGGKSMATLARTRTTIALLGLAAVAWVVTVERMRGMDEGPATDLGGLGWYLGVWVTMTAAMMLPSVVRVAPAIQFAIGYLAVWTACGLVAYAVFRSGISTEVAGWLIVAAGLYELTPLKQRSLRHCREQSESAGALRSGVAHGVDCVGCSGGLMVALFALGAMSLLWMAVVAAAIFAEKVLPHGVWVSRVVAVALLALGTWVALSPESVPGLAEPMEMAR